MFTQEDHKQLSLLDLKCDYFEYTGEQVSKVAIHKQFTPEAVNFLKAIFSRQLAHQVNNTPDKDADFGPFSAVYIKDSTKFKLPVAYHQSYPGYGSFNKTSALMNLQYEFDLLNGTWKRLELTKATRNDQTESKETLQAIQPGSLNIRDLGYITPSYLQAVENGLAYYLNRLPKLGVYTHTKDGYVALDWGKINKQIKNGALKALDLDVYLGKEDKLKSRMIIIPVTEEVAKERIRKASQSGKRSKGYQLSKAYRIKAHYNIFITNVPRKTLSYQQIVAAYKLRWQIELVFKTWKSTLKIHEVKAMRKERLECQLIAKFIWILLNSKLFQVINIRLNEMYPDKKCSLVKFFKRAKKFSPTLRTTIPDSTAFALWFETTLQPIIDSLIIEKRLEKNHTIT